MRRVLKYIFCVLIVLVAFSATGIGDVGDFNDYDSGSSWSSSSSDSWGSSSSSSDWDGSSSSSSDGGGWGTLEISLLILFFLIYGISYLIDVLWKMGRPSLPAAPSEAKDPYLAQVPSFAKWPPIADHTAEITSALQKQDPAFNAVAFLEWAKEVFFKLQYAWSQRDWEQVRPLESEALYATHARQLQEYKRLGRINILERINVNNAYFFSLVKDKEWETLSVVMHVRMIDYIIDEHTRQVLKGSPDRDCFMSYFYVFKRKAGVKTTTAKQGVDTIACPNCGAPTHVVSSGKCEYCNFVITVKDHGWVLTDIVGIKPPYNYGAGGVIIKNQPEE